MNHMEWRNDIFCDTGVETQLANIRKNALDEPRTKRAKVGFPEKAESNAIVQNREESIKTDDPINLSLLWIQNEC